LCGGGCSACGGGRARGAQSSRGTVAAALIGADAPAVLRAGEGMRWPCPDGGDSPDRRGRAGGWVDRDRDLYRWRGSPSPDRYHGHHGIQAIVRDVVPGGAWPTLTKTN
jgi:hypothetical protein